MNKKICSACDTEKLLSEYYKNRNTRDGYHSSCKDCMSKSKNHSNKRIHKVTEKELQYIVDNWAKEETSVIARYLKVTPATLSSYAGILRKLGVKIEHKSKMGNRVTFLKFAEDWKNNQIK